MSKNQDGCQFVPEMPRLNETLDRFVTRLFVLLVLTVAAGSAGSAPQAPVERGSTRLLIDAVALDRNNGSDRGEG